MLSFINLRAYSHFFQPQWSCKVALIVSALFIFANLPPVYAAETTVNEQRPTTQISAANARNKNANQSAQKVQVEKLVGTTGSIFLRGNFIELGMHTLGSFGAEDYVSEQDGFHPWENQILDQNENIIGQLGFIVDPDGWDTGNPPTTSGDFFYPWDTRRGMGCYLVIWHSANRLIYECGFSGWRKR